jgi:hypothetical protein
MMDIDNLLEQRLNKLKTRFDNEVLAGRSQEKMEKDMNSTDPEFSVTSSQEVLDTQTVPDANETQNTSSPKRTSLVIFKEDGQNAGEVILHSNGEISYEGGYSPSDAAKLFWDHVKDQIKEFFKLAPPVDNDKLEELTQENMSLLTILGKNKDILGRQMNELEKAGTYIQELENKFNHLQQQYGVLKHENEEQFVPLNRQYQVLLQQNVYLENVLITGLQQKLVEAADIIKTMGEIAAHK